MAGKIQLKCFDVGLVSNKGFKFVFVPDCVPKFGSQRTTVNMFETLVHFLFSGSIL